MKSSETLLLQDVWRQALNRGPEGLTVKFKSKSGAVRARLQLYSSVRAVKKGLDMDDLELCKAAEELEITWVDDCTIRLSPKANSDAMQGLIAAAGKRPEDYIDPDLAASAERMLREFGIGQPAASKPEELPEIGQHQSNPFYSKRG